MMLWRFCNFIGGAPKAICMVKHDTFMQFFFGISCFFACRRCILMHFNGDRSMFCCFEVDQKSISIVFNGVILIFQGQNRSGHCQVLCAHGPFLTPFDAFSSVIVGVLEGGIKNLPTSRSKRKFCCIGPTSGQKVMFCWEGRTFKKNVRPSRSKRWFLGLSGSKVDVLIERGEGATRFPS